MAYRPYKSANPATWGAVLGVIAALIVFAAALVGEHSTNSLLTSPAKAGGAGFGFGFLVAMFRNWLNERGTGR